LDVYRTEEEQTEAIKHWLRENGLALITGLMLGLAVLFGFKTWTEYGERQAETASNLYMQFAVGVTQDEEAAVTAYDSLVKDFPDSEYAVLASLHMAKLRLEKDDLTAAQAHLQWALDRAGVDALEHTARLRLARVLLGNGDVDAADKLIAGISDPSYTVLYEELRGDIAQVRNDMQAAQAAYERALAAMPEGLPGRALIEAKRDDSVRGSTGQAS
jgi:predicted negative regulator of RcsB-dependent stress response